MKLNTGFILIEEFDLEAITVAFRQGRLYLKTDDTAENAAESGIMVSLPMPALNAPTEPASTDSAAATANATAAPAAVPATTEEPAAQPTDNVTAPEQTSTETANVPAATPATAQPPQPKAAAMPKDDDWDLPSGFDSKNAFVPIEAE